MATLIFDIETAGFDYESFDETTQHALTRWIKQDAGDNEESYEAALTNVKEGLGFSPLTGAIVAIGMYDLEREKGAVYFQPSPGTTEENFEEDQCKFEAMDEKTMLEKFWTVAEKYDTFVTFNGRGFDVPFLMIRSMIHGIRPSKNLLANRYLSSQPYNAKHVDLLDQLSFYGAVWKNKGSLHMWCQALGIESPKSGGIDGNDVKKFFESGKAKEIALYNGRDLSATAALYKKYREFIAF